MSSTRNGLVSVVMVLHTATVACSVPGEGASGTGTTTVAAREVREAQRAGSVVPETPTDVRLPSGALVGIRPVRTRPDGLLPVPSDVRRAGWWSGGSRLGDPFGSTLLAGHVDSVRQGLGPYAELLAVRPGDRVVLRSAHLRQEFTVVSLRLVPQGALRDDRVLYSPRGPRRLTLVTCAPPYDRDRGGYQNLGVVTATPSGTPEPRRSR